jgi:hypothetical protein
MPRAIEPARGFRDAFEALLPSRISPGEQALLAAVWEYLGRPDLPTPKAAELKQVRASSRHDDRAGVVRQLKQNFPVGEEPDWVRDVLSERLVTVDRVFEAHHAVVSVVIALLPQWVRDEFVDTRPTAFVAMASATKAPPPAPPSAGVRVAASPADERGVEHRHIDAADLKAAVTAHLGGWREAATRLLSSAGIDGHAAVDESSARRFLSERAAFATPACDPVPVLADAPYDEVWFAGDVHGDLLGLECVFAAFEASSAARKALVFLGDLVDDGPHQTEVVVRVLGAMADAPGRIAWLSGNHDEGVRWSPERGFTTTVSPGEYVDALNALSDEGDGAVPRRIGRLFAAFAARLPRALMLPGLLAAHGGFPHEDLLGTLETRADLGSPRCQKDFVWNRLAEGRIRIPNRASSGTSFGSENFAKFRAKAGELGAPIEWMVRGHDHIQETARWWRPAAVPRGSYEERILTLNSLAYTQARETNAFLQVTRHRWPTVARWVPGSRPVPVVLTYDEALANWYAPPCTTCGRPNPTGAAKCGHHRNGEPGTPCDGSLAA